MEGGGLRKLEKNAKRKEKRKKNGKERAVER